jgi:NTE family protein
MSQANMEAASHDALDRALLTSLLPVSREVPLAAGGELHSIAGSNDVLIIVLSGSLDLRAGDQVLATRRDGEIVGALNLVGDHARSVTAVATADSCLLCVSAQALLQLTQDNPDALHRLAKAVLRLPSQHLQRTPLFAAIDGEALSELDRTAAWINLRAGEILCRQGEAADALWVVVHGRLEVIAEAPDGERVLDILERNAVAGEMALLDGEPRSATVRAIRDSELIRIPGDTFEHLLQRPSFAVTVARGLASRLRHTSMTPRLVRRARTIALIAAGTGRVPPAFSAELEAALAGPHGNVLCLRSEAGNAALLEFDEESSGFLTSWLYDNEAAFRFIVVECDPTASPWTLRAIRQADLVLTVAYAGGDPAPNHLERLIVDDPALKRVRRELVLLHPRDTERPRDTGRWLEQRPSLRHHHLRLGSTPDFARLARWVGGSSLGVVLSGGGARGFAHIGALRALSDCGLGVDYIGGSSVGAMIAAQAALGWDFDTIIARNKEEFARWSMIRDITYPHAALQSGNNTVRLMTALFGDARIEDLWLPYFSVSTNLTRAKEVVHETGPIWLWTRASCSVPGIVPPVSYEGDLLVDGGVLNNLPTNLMRERCPGLVLAVDVSAAMVMAAGQDTRASLPGWPHLWRAINRRAQPAAFPNMMEILMRAATLSTSSASERSQIEADLYLHPPVDSFSGTRWAAIDKLVEIGYHYARERIEAWQAGRELDVARMVGTPAT